MKLSIGEIVRSGEATQVQQCDRYASSQEGTQRSHPDSFFKCKWHDFSSITISQFTKHLLTHTGEKTHHCNIAENYSILVHVLRIMNLGVDRYAFLSSPQQRISQLSAKKVWRDWRRGVGKIKNFFHSGIFVFTLLGNWGKVPPISLVFIVSLSLFL